MESGAEEAFPWDSLGLGLQGSVLEVGRGAKTNKESGTEHPYLSGCHQGAPSTDHHAVGHLVQSEIRLWEC
jgi:hypothetical protein